MPLDQPRHQSAAARLDDGSTLRGQCAWRARDGFDPAAFDQHIGGIGSIPAPIPDFGATKQRTVHCLTP